MNAYTFWFGLLKLRGLIRICNLMSDVSHTETSIVLLSYPKALWIIHSKYSWISYEFKYKKD